MPRFRTELELKRELYAVRARDKSREQITTFESRRGLAHDCFLASGRCRVSELSDTRPYTYYHESFSCRSKITQLCTPDIWEGFQATSVSGAIGHVYQPNNQPEC